MNVQSSYRLSPRITLRRGDRFRVGRGPEHRGVRCGLRGVFEFRSAWTQGRRVFVEATRIERGLAGGRYVLFVEGRAFHHPDLPGLLMRPYRLRRIRSPVRRIEPPRLFNP